MARAIRASASSALIVHSEKGSDPCKLDEGRMAHPPFGMPAPPAGPIVIGSKWFLQISSNSIQAGCVRSCPGQGSCEARSLGGWGKLFASLCNFPAVTLENPVLPPSVADCIWFYVGKAYCLPTGGADRSLDGDWRAFRTSMTTPNLKPMKIPKYDICSGHLWITFVLHRNRIELNCRLGPHDDALDAWVGSALPTAFAA